MKFVVALAILVVCVSAVPLVEDEELARDRRQWATIGKIALNIAVKFVGALVKNHYSDVDLIVKGRAMRAHIVSKENPAQVTLVDRSSGTSAMGTGADLQAAIAMAAETLIQDLLRLGYMSIHDLHLPPTPPTPKPVECLDTFGGDLCLEYAILGYCTNHFRDFMKMSCLASCGFCY